MATISERSRSKQGEDGFKVSPILCDVLKSERTQQGERDVWANVWEQRSLGTYNGDDELTYRAVPPRASHPTLIRQFRRSRNRMLERQTSGVAYAPPTQMYLERSNPPAPISQSMVQLPKEWISLYR
jgi:hypothetical protein